ncbi:putative serine/threonine-protein kinase SgK494 [Paragonimus westermani]|uniref:Putative serine/threonine-protein kinase SgK494 n=1 Tax=Paragonimus westermani TaxID=34504 RepID=A0A5J4NK09_9TREM|nr:putative serine/threonine-protein kinase SgK494 [Paragonimus westermani]
MSRLSEDDDRNRHVSYEEQLLEDVFLHEFPKGSFGFKKKYQMENILFNLDGYLKLIDFGASKQMDTRSLTRTWTICGTLAYAAPEMLNGDGYTFLVDWWAFGILCHALSFGKFPIQPVNDHHQMRKSINNHNYTIPDGAHPDLAEILQQLLQKDPHKRIYGCDTLKSLDFYRGKIDFNAVLNKQEYKTVNICVLIYPGILEYDSSTFFSDEDIKRLPHSPLKQRLQASGPRRKFSLDDRTSEHQNTFEAFSSASNRFSRIELLPHSKSSYEIGQVQMSEILVPLARPSWSTETSTNTDYSEDWVTQEQPSNEDEEHAAQRTDSTSNVSTFIEQSDHSPNSRVIIVRAANTSAPRRTTPVTPELILERSSKNTFVDVCDKVYPRVSFEEPPALSGYDRQLGTRSRQNWAFMSDRVRKVAAFQPYDPEPMSTVIWSNRAGHSFRKPTYSAPVVLKTTKPFTHDVHYLPQYIFRDGTPLHSSEYNLVAASPAAIDRRIFIVRQR